MVEFEAKQLSSVCEIRFVCIKSGKISESCSSANQQCCMILAKHGPTNLYQHYLQIEIHFKAKEIEVSIPIQS